MTVATPGRPSARTIIEGPLAGRLIGLVFTVSVVGFLIALLAL
jgi:hypothetical protein